MESGVDTWGKEEGEDLVITWVFPTGIPVLLI